MAKIGRNELAVGFLVLGALALLAWMSLQVGALRRLNDEVRVSTLFQSAAGLTEGSYVQVAGVPVGRVAGLAVEDGRARVSLALREEAGIHKDAVARVRARSLLGEKYVELTQGTDAAPLVADGDQIAAGPELLEIDELVTRLGPLVSAIDPQAMSELVGALSQALREDPERLNRVLADVETLMHNAALASAEAPALASEARSTLTEVRQVAREARPMIKRADAALVDLELAVEDAPETMDALNALLTDGRGMVSDGRALMSRMEGSMTDVEKILQNLSEIDRWELRRLLREEGIVVRLREKKVTGEEPVRE